MELAHNFAPDDATKKVRAVRLRDKVETIGVQAKRLGTPPASSSVIVLRSRTGSCLLSYDGEQASPAILMIVPSYVLVVSVTGLVLIDSNTSAAGAADTGTYGRRIAASANHRNGRHLADED
jgi:hypothetical protein